MFVLPRRLYLFFSICLALVAVMALGFGIRSVSGSSDSPPAAPAVAPGVVTAAAAGLHNPGFDNHLWYWFHERHGYGRNLVPDSFVPDDDAQNGPQQWWLWFHDGTVPILTWASTEIHQGDRAVKGRTYWDGRLQAGLFQIVYDATPCLTYEFQMYGKAKLNESGDVLRAFRVGIDRVGFRPDTWGVSSFPNTTVWGPSHTEYVNTYGPLAVSAEAWSSTLSVYTYAEADGGKSVEFVWDTGSFREATPDMIHDPANLPAPGGINIMGVHVGSTTTAIDWTTSNQTVGQVYYRRAPHVGPTPTYTNTVYLPIVLGTVSKDWLVTPLIKTASTAHSANITGLLPGTTYQFLVVSRGLSGGQCVTWVSQEGTFTTNN